MTEVTVIGQIAMPRNHELMIYTGERVFAARHNVQPQTHDVDVAILASASVAVRDQFCSICSHFFDMCQNT